MSQPCMSQPTLIMHAWKTSIMAIIFWDTYSVNIITSMAHEDGFIILNILDIVMRCFKNHFKTEKIKANLKWEKHPRGDDGELGFF